MAVKQHKLVDALAQAGNTVLLAGGDDDRSAGGDTFDRLGNAQFVLAAMTPGKHQCGVEAGTFGLRRDIEARRCRARKCGRKPCTR
ncbi:hypothetical protein AJ88_42945 [Mesorhizobium amorphae CCBAU 01583]|nr:hypothetical protein AJ88_42945 [Mesorhizobium amorphae CCBAU 01583]